MKRWLLFQEEKNYKFALLRTKNYSLCASFRVELEAIEKGGYSHFMLKEIYEQPRSIKDCMRGRLNADKGVVQLGGILDHEAKFLKAKRIILLHAVQVGMRV